MATSDVQVTGTLTARFNRDPLGLGRTAGQRGAEIIAGIRAELMRTPETQALSKLSGRLTAKTMMALEREGMFNYIPARFESMTQLALHLAPFSSGLVLTEVAAGFSPRGIHLARRIPEAQVLEIDLADVILEKRRRLERHPEILVPRNLHWRAADLSQQALSEVLNSKLVDVIIAEELLLYFPLQEGMQLLTHSLRSLKRNGVLLCSIGFQPGIEQAQRAARFFNRQVGGFRGTVYTENEATRLFRDAGYTDIEVHRISKLAQQMKLIDVPADIELVVVARRP
jgi:O-methyltransferase involved in polyketide biosynthesis